MSTSIGLIEVLLLAVAGGLVLNVMPCVLPVLTLKVFHMIEHGHEDASTHRRHGIAYVGGVLATFAVFATGVVLLKTAGEAVGWGMQFSNPAFVGALTILIFVFGLNALGVFEVNIGVSGGGGGRGVTDSFVNGIVAAVMSTPCTAPFLSTAATFALAETVPAWQTYVIFMAVGFGLALPFLAVSFVPAVGRMLPRPGMWMETFKQVMGFSLLGAAVWLFATLQHQIEPKAAAGFGYFIWVLAMLLWGWQRFGGPEFGARRRLAVSAVVAGGALGAGLLLLDFTPRAREQVASVSDAAVVDGRINWAAFDPEYIAAVRASGRPVFIDYTAEWCANCKANERLYIETEPVRTLLTQTGIVPVKADLTNEDAVILEWLEAIDRSGLPAYALYMPDGTVDVLPQVITTELLLERFTAAAVRFPASGFTEAPARERNACPTPECPVIEEGSGS